MQASISPPSNTRGGEPRPRRTRTEEEEEEEQGEVERRATGGKADAAITMRPASQGGARLRASMGASQSHAPAHPLKKNCYGRSLGVAGRLSAY